MNMTYRREIENIEFPQENNTMTKQLHIGHEKSKTFIRHHLVCLLEKQISTKSSDLILHAVDDPI